MDLNISATALCATAWLIGHEFCVLSSVLEFWLMVYGFVFENLLLGGGHGVPGHSGPPAPPPPGPVRPTENRFPELLAASGRSWECLEASGIDYSC